MKIQLVSLILGFVGLAGATGLLIGDDVYAETLRTSYFGNGQAKESVAFEDSQRHGPCKRWYQDGSLRAEGEFEHGKMVGEWTWLAPDGTRDSERSGIYEAGQRKGQ